MWKVTYIWLSGQEDYNLGILQIEKMYIPFKMWSKFVFLFT